MYLSYICLGLIIFGAVKLGNEESKKSAKKPYDKQMIQFYKILIAFAFGGYVMIEVITR